MRILAFNAAHDSSVCVLNDGKLEFFCKEERISRKKRDNLPFKSLELVRQLNLGPIDHAVYSVPSDHELNTRNLLQLYFHKTFNTDILFSSFGHHLSHAMLAFTNSLFDNALVFVIDRDGSVVVINENPVARESESVFVFDKEKGYHECCKRFWLMDKLAHREHIEDLIQSHYPHADVEVHNECSVVKVYEAATTLIGQNPLENGKTMGLASYGEDLEYSSLFFEGIALSHKFTTLPTKQMCFYGEESLIEKNITTENYQYYANRAKQVQLQTQEEVLNLIKKYTQTHNIRNVCIVGGYALNVVANNYYIKNLPDINFYFEPTADDTGVPIGAAMLQHMQITSEIPEPLLVNNYHFYDSRQKVDIGKKANISQLVDLLVAGKSLAIFDGNPEAGPRALGHRSILFDPRNPETKDIVNRIKQREWYRPFAGVILEEEFDNYFETLGIKSSPYMTINFDAKQNAKQLAPGVIHVDGTCRVQTVNDGFLYELLKAFYKKTNCPILLNTSFNLAGQPLVQNKSDAIWTLNNSELNAVYFVDEKKLLLK